MGKISLNDIIITPLKRIAVPNGDVMHGMKMTDPGYAGFGEAYFSWIEADAVKAWKKHTSMTMNIVVPVGNIRLVFCVDPAQGFREERIGTANYARLTVPPGIWFGFQGIDAPQSLLLNVASILHDPGEVERCSVETIHYNW